MLSKNLGLYVSSLLLLALVHHADSQGSGLRRFLKWPRSPLTQRLKFPPGPGCRKPCTSSKTLKQTLFSSVEEIREIAATRQFDDLFVIIDKKHTINFPAVCMEDIDNLTSKSKRISKCSGYQPDRPNTCCTTKMQMIAPGTVSSVYTGSSHSVVHKNSSYQYVHEAYCENPLCGGGGTCNLKYRIQWILVDVAGVESFHPVLVGNHCDCKHTVKN